MAARVETGPPSDYFEKCSTLPKDPAERPDDLMVCGLIAGMELAAWLRSHPDWTITGEWDDARYAAPVWITDAGREALAKRERYDMEPALGGPVEPGWSCVPLPVPDTTDHRP